jgi:hypothetical protein
LLPEGSVIFLDRCLGRQIVAARLRSQGLTVEIHADHFPQIERAPEQSDRDWLMEVGKRGWIVFTKDEKLRRNQVEIVGLLRSGAPCFVSTAGNMTGEQIADSFLAAMPQIRRILTKFQPPFIATVSRFGKVAMFLTYSALIRRA